MYLSPSYQLRSTPRTIIEATRRCIHWMLDVGCWMLDVPAKPLLLDVSPPVRLGPKPLLLLLFVVALPLHAADYKPLEDPKRPIATTQSVPPAEAAQRMTFPPGFHAQLVAGEPDIVQPIAYTIDDRGRIWLVENTNYPVCPGQPKDRILILENFGPDGKPGKTTVFYDKLTFASGIAVGHGGVWVGAPPNLLFFPLKDGEEKFTGEPQVVLDGWGHDDTHETLNDFTWGPDGWLYGTQGIFTFSHVGKPGTPDNERTYLDAGVWRYHPLKKKIRDLRGRCKQPVGRRLG